ncbi:MAG: bifunctional riboflavin kinase/FAD synthetase [Kiritimatiellia bacterium]
MKTVKDISSVAGRRPIMLAVGFFDGIHRGHKKVIGQAIQSARQAGGEAWVFTFDRHPLSILAPDSAPVLLTSGEHKLSLLERMGVDGCVVLPFTTEAASLSPAAFAARLLDCAPPLKRIFAGRNWKFGRNSAGTVYLLKRAAEKVDVQVTAVVPVRRRKKFISSSRIRCHVGGGNLKEAEIMLGRPYGLMGKVVRGDSRGFDLGFPTANLDTKGELLPPDGVYAVSALAGRRAAHGVLNVGVRPTFGDEGRGRTVEVHLINHGKNLYGKTIEILFAARIRNERAFSSKNLLKSQISRDIGKAAGILRRKKPHEKFQEWLYTNIPRLI